MPRVRNTKTGLEHDVPVNHFSLTDEDYEVLDDELHLIQDASSAGDVSIAEPVVKPVKKKGKSKT